jgi:hypothetical protein
MTGPGNGIAMGRQLAIGVASFGLTAMLILTTVQGSGVFA